MLFDNDKFIRLHELGFCFTYIESIQSYLFSKTCQIENGRKPFGRALFGVRGEKFSVGVRVQSQSWNRIIVGVKSKSSTSGLLKIIEIENKIHLKILKYTKSQV